MSCLLWPSSSPRSLQVRGARGLGGSSRCRDGRRVWNCRESRPGPASVRPGPHLMASSSLGERNLCSVGVDPKTIVCEHYRHGKCTKGFKCKFSHDLSIERKGPKASIYEDRSGIMQGLAVVTVGRGGSGQPSLGNTAAVSPAPDCRRVGCLHAPGSHPASGPGDQGSPARPFGPSPSPKHAHLLQGRGGEWRPGRGDGRLGPG